MLVAAMDLWCQMHHSSEPSEVSDWKDAFASEGTYKDRYVGYPKSESDGWAASPSGSSVPLVFGFVYFIRNKDLFKIGVTENILRRLKQLAPDELLNVVRCSNFQEVEREPHRKFKDVRLPQTEYFRLSDQQVQEVHQLMMKLAEFPSK